jgi:hypothetical protein
VLAVGHRLQPAVAMAMTAVDILALAIAVDILEQAALAVARTSLLVLAPDSVVSLCRFDAKERSRGQLEVEDTAGV